MIVNFIWEGERYPIETKVENSPTSGEYVYIDFVSFLEGLGKEGRDDLISTILINHSDEVEKIEEVLRR